MKSVYVTSSVQDLANLAEASLPAIDNDIQLIRYFRSAQQILMQADIYKGEGDFEKAYIHMMKYSILMLQKLPKHTQYRQPEVQKDITSAKQTVRKLLNDMEAMKLVLQKQYDEEKRVLEMQKQKEREEQLAIEREQKEREEREEAERAAHEAQLKAYQEEQQRREQEERQRLDMEMFATQQLHGRAGGHGGGGGDGHGHGHGGRGPLGAHGHAGGAGQQDTGQAEDILLPLQQMQLRDPRLHDPLLHDPLQVSDDSPQAPPPNLPQDFFMEEQMAGDHPAFQQQPPNFQQEHDFLTPIPPPTHLPPSLNEPPSPSAPLLDIPSDAFTVAAPVNRFSHLDALAPPSKEQIQVADRETAKAPVDYPNLYSTASSSSNFKYVPSSTSVNSPPIPSQPIVRNQTPQYAPMPSHPYPQVQNIPFPMSSQPPQYLPQSRTQMLPHPRPQLQSQPQFQSQLPPQYIAQSQPRLQSQIHPQAQPQPQPQQPSPSPSRLIQQPPQPYNQQPPQPQQPQAKQAPRPTTNFMPPTGSSKGRIEESPKEFMPSAPNANTSLRKIIVYGEMFEAFMRVAQSNTQRKIETCAILAGTLSKNAFCITTMIVPKQEGTTDTCSTTNEEELFEYQMSNNLLTLGWIHTHPTQDCFMSSVDLHTHCTYQLLLPEAIAVVISPMFTPNFGIFRVSDPPGMQIISKCNLRGFHQHADTFGKTLYTLCDHVELVWGSKSFKVVDLR